MVDEKTGKSIGAASVGDSTPIFNGYPQYLLQRGGSPFDAAGEPTIGTEESLEVLEGLEFIW